MARSLKRYCLLFAAFVWPVAAQADGYDLVREILAELVVENTAPSGGNDMRGAVRLLVERLRQEGFDEADFAIVDSAETLPNLVIRFRSPAPKRRPLLTMAHLDGVEALPEDWSVEPFALTETDGFLYGRGTLDNKAGAAILVASLIRMKHEGFEPDRDIIVMLTADEETTGRGATLLANEHRDLIDAEFALNTDGGFVLLRGGKPSAFLMQTSEKVYVTYRLTALDPGGHSSRPHADSAISRLARTLVGLAGYRFPIDLNDTTRAYFERWYPLAPEEERDLIRDLLDGRYDDDLSARLDAMPYYNALARTTCVATQLSGGHAENALPQTASAVVNCRVLPQSSEETARAAIAQFAAPNDVSIEEIFPYIPSPPSPLNPDIVGPIRDVAQEFWPGIEVIPEMSTGATDGLFVRNAGIPVYSVSAILRDPDDSRVHGQDERIGVDMLRDANEYWYRLLKRLSRQ